MHAARAEAWVMLKWLLHLVQRSHLASVSLTPAEVAGYAPALGPLVANPTATLCHHKLPFTEQRLCSQDLGGESKTAEFHI